MSEDKWLKCTKCNVPLKPVDNDDYVYQIDDGLCVSFRGAYGMFIDSLDGDNPVATLCHDCVVDLLEFFPESFKEKFNGGHPFSHKPDGKCCRYAWSFKEDSNGMLSNE